MIQAPVDRQYLCYNPYHAGKEILYDVACVAVVHTSERVQHNAALALATWLHAFRFDIFNEQYPRMMLRRLHVTVKTLDMDGQGEIGVTYEMEENEAGDETTYRVAIPFNIHD